MRQSISRCSLNAGAEYPNSVESVAKLICQTTREPAEQSRLSCNQDATWYTPHVSVPGSRFRFSWAATAAASSNDSSLQSGIRPLRACPKIKYRIFTWRFLCSLNGIYANYYAASPKQHRDEYVRPLVCHPLCGIKLCPMPVHPPAGDVAETIGFHVHPFLSRK